jgi:hypothetical protein
LFDSIAFKENPAMQSRWPRRPVATILSVVVGMLGLVVLPIASAKKPAVSAPADSAASGGVSGAPATVAWPAVTVTNKPWSRWWWPGSAVDKANLTREIENAAKAGLGGLEVTPIYPAAGTEARQIQFLSPEYVRMLQWAGQEAKRLGLKMDMATGTGWPFGGPWVKPEDGAQGAALVDGKLAPKPTGMKVKRSAPGGVGLVIDPYSTKALADYLEPFDKALAGFPKGLLRSQFHDSFEYYGANWTAGFPEAFQKAHGYDIQQYAAELMGQKTMDNEKLARLLDDYRQTLGQLHVNYVKAWTAWAHKNGWLSRNQAHGSPTNLLDAYGAADIPETEIYGSTSFPIPGFRHVEGEVKPGSPNPLMYRMPASAAHVMGKPLVSSESCTWMREHWKETLAEAKPELDQIMLNGINHIVYHGNCYSPADAPWPGWLFYAATQFNDRNPIWRDFPALNHYIQRAQSVLQAGAPDNDVLIYWPIDDAWSTVGGRSPEMRFEVGNTVSWLAYSEFGMLASGLEKQGYGFDYVSDAQLAQASVKGGALVTPGSRYKALVVPACTYMPPATLKRILDLAAKGAVVVVEGLPSKAPGLGHLEERQAELEAQIKRLSFHAGGAGSAKAEEAMLGRGRVVRGNAIAALAASGVQAESIVPTTGVGMIRRAHAGGFHYFLANLTAKPLDGWVKLGTPLASAALMDPLTDRVGLAATRPGDAGQGEIYLQLAPGQSIVLWTSSKGRLKAKPWEYLAAAGAPVEIKGTWDVTFVAGGPALPKPFQTAELKSWTDLGGPDAQVFGGTANYRIEFEKPAGATADAWRLDLGDVRESARVRLNGKPVATAWSLPYVVDLGALKDGKNVLELEVTNVAANRVRDLDMRGVQWKTLARPNPYVSINGQPFDASGWALTPSGLLGPVRLEPMKKLDPTAGQ